MRRIPTATVCASLVLIAGCGTASSPRDAAGVRAMYRSIGLDASAGDFIDVCRSYMVQPLRGEVSRSNHGCVAASSTSKLERWAEKIRLSKVKSGTRIVVSGHEALVDDATRPERALYVDGQWQLSEVPELTARR
jgi:hypothetical protein